MKRISCTGTLLAVAIAGYSGAAVGQQACDSDIQQLRTQNQQRQADEQQRRQVTRMLDRAENAGPGECRQFVSQARQQLQESGGDRVSGAPGPQQTQSQGRQQTEPTRKRAPTLERQQQQQTQQQRQGTGQMDVQIEQAPAEVEVDTGSPTVVVRQQPPKVTVEQQPPIVEITQPEAKVNVTQAEPRVSINQAEPNIEVHEAEAEVQVQQAGEPIVRMLGPGSDAEGTQPPQQAAAAESRQDEDRQRAAGSGWVSAGEASRLVGATALSSDGDEVGEISEIVRSRADNELHAVVDVGGFFGIGQRPVAIPVGDGEVDQDGNLRVDYSSAQLEQMDEYDRQQYEQVQ